MEKSYYCDPEGSVSDISGDGWHQVGDYYFYIKNGQHLSNTVEKLESPIMALTTEALCMRIEIFLFGILKAK